MVLFKILEQKNSCYDFNFLTRLSILYKGGYHVIRNSDLFLHQLASETPPSFEDRKKCCSYMPFMSDIIDYYTSMLFSTEVGITEATDANDTSTLGNATDDHDIYRLFFAAADLKCRSMEEVMRHAVSDALIYSYSFVGLDFPKADQVPVNLLEEEVLQTARPYVYDVDPECVIDWSYNEADKFNWVKIKSDCVVQPDPLQPPMHQIEYKIWTMENGFAKWSLYQTKLLKMDKFPAPNDEISLVDSGVTTFREIPILKLQMPPGLALGMKIGPICEDIYQRTSLLVNGQNKSLNAMRVVFLGDESSIPGGAQASMVQENPFRHLSVVADWESKGIGVLGANDKMEVIESKGHAFVVVSEQIDTLIQRLKEVVHQMANAAAPHSAAIGKSAQSKQEDRHSTEMLLTAYGNITRDFIKNIMSCISSARSESIVWVINGLDNFTIEDRDQIIVEAAQFQSVIQQSMSPTFTKLYTEKLYTALLDGASHDNAIIIRKELTENVDKIPEFDPNKQAVDSQGKPVQETIAKTAPASKAVSKATLESPPLGESGHIQGPDGMHLQTGEHIDSQVIYDQLSDDYNEKDIEWVLHIPWVGPVEVPLTSIDFSNKSNWQADSEPEEVSKFVDLISNEGFSKPIILVNNPSNNNKMVIVDGHHRALAYAQMNQPALAYIGQIGKNSGPWDKLHDKQGGSKQSSGQESKQVSGQMTSNQSAPELT